MPEFTDYKIKKLFLIGYNTSNIFKITRYIQQNFRLRHKNGCGMITDKSCRIPGPYLVHLFMSLFTDSPLDAINIAAPAIERGGNDS